VYEMTFADNVRTLERHPGAPDFSQRVTGTFDHDRDTIVGRWESSSDSSNWKPDLDLTYTLTQQPDGSHRITSPRRAGETGPKYVRAPAS